MTIDIGLFQVDWTLASDRDRALAAATVGRLVDDVLEPVLDDALHDVVRAEELVAVRSVHVRPLQVHRAEDAAGWAGAVSAAVAGAVAAGGVDVVRYRSPGAAVLDVLRCITLGDTRREWAWRMLGLWPAALAPEPADVVFALLLASPAGVVPVLEAAGSCLPDALDLLGPDRLARLSAASWTATGAAPVVFPVRLDRSADQPTAGVSAVRTSELGRALVAEVAASAGTAPRSPDVLTAVPGGTDIRAVALAALLVAHADPAAVHAGRGAAQVAALLRAAADQPQVAQAPPSEPTGSPAPAPGRNRPMTAPTAAPTAPAASSDRAPAGLPAAAVVATTRWAGLLFCLHPLRPLLEPGAPPDSGTVAAASVLFETAGALPTLHALGVELCARAVTSPWESGPRADDPALLTFCGLAPASAPPLGLDRPDEVAAIADQVVVALRARLAGRPPAALDDGALLRTVLRRHGTVVSDPGWRRVDLLLDEVSVDLRAALLDLDPGWLPMLGCVVRFCYG